MNRRTFLATGGYENAAGKLAAEFRKYVVSLLIVALLWSLTASQDDRTPDGILEEIRLHKEGLAVWWMGNTGWLIKSDGVLIGTDLDLEPGGKIEPPPVTPEGLARQLDVAFVTHHHGDHFNRPTLHALAAGKCRFVLPRTCVKRVRSEEHTSELQSR